MPDGSNHQTFIGPRIFTRRQFLKGLGGGAMTLGLGYLQACEACGGTDGRNGTTGRTTGGRTTGAPSGDPQTILRDEMGDKAASYIRSPVTDPKAIDYIARRASSFGSACNLGGVSDGFRLTVVDRGPFPPLDIGGEFTNDLSYLAPIDLEQSAAFAEYFSEETGREVNKENTFAFFVTNRFFDALVSNANEQPVVGIADAVVIIATDEDDGNDRVIAKVYLIDCGGVQLLGEVEADKDAPPPPGEIDRNPNLVSRESRVNAYFGNLVAEYTNDRRETRQVLLPYDPFDFEDPLPPEAPRHTSFAGIQGVQYQRVDQDVPPENYGEPSDPNDTGGPSSKAGVWYQDPEFRLGLAVPGYPLNIGISQPGPQPPPPPPPGDGPWGDPENYQPGDFRCFNYDAKDNCKSCCRTAELTALGVLGGGVLSCAITFALTTCTIVLPLIGTVSCFFVCCGAAAVLALATVYKGQRCESNCNNRVRV